MWKKNQSVTSRNEPELGVGRILDLTGSSRLKVHFARVDETRSYNLQPSPPIERCVLKVGDRAVVSAEREFTIDHIEEDEGIFRYIGESDSCWEFEIQQTGGATVSSEKFLDSEPSHFRAFDLRREAWRIRGAASGQTVSGLVGPRVKPLPHQLYIARTVVKQHRPRVLLADEVGLGKTIEAGLIFSALRSLDRAGRVLWLIPETLKHQWLAEMYRRFNELVTGLDEERCQQEEESQGGSPFELFQKVSTSIDFLLEHPERLEQACESHWDLLVVDEAHHLKFGGEGWKSLQKLSQSCHGLLLLTATPRMYGLKNHFGLLNLADPDRFSSFDDFQKSTEKMNAVAQLAQKLQAGDDQLDEELSQLFPGETELLQLLEKGDKSGLLSALVDRHGTSRMFFRNRRALLKGFPNRILQHQSIGAGEKKQWLIDLVNGSEEKFLLICSSVSDVKRLSRLFSEERIAVFHEEMTVLDRDLQAARFYGDESVQLMICSEIGGEGRNFQFCHQLILFDLPLVPDVIEQRIGRLDRIGQKRDIRIFTAWEKETAEEVAFRYYHEGLDAFQSSWNGTSQLFEKFREPLNDLCTDFDEVKLQSLLEETKSEVSRLKAEIEDSVDTLVDINSFDENLGSELVEDVEDRDDDPTLEFFIKGVFDLYAVEYRDYDDRGSFIVSAESLSFIDHFPGLSTDRDTVMTFDRDIALQREDIVFLSQDHTIAEEALSLLLDRNEGVFSVCRWAGGKQSQGLIAEFSFVVAATGPVSLELNRYFPLEVVTIRLDHSGKKVEESPEEEDLREVPKEHGVTDDPRLRQLLGTLLQSALEFSEKLEDDRRGQAMARAELRFSEEEKRMRYLSSVNPHFDTRELEMMLEKKTEVLKCLSEIRPRLDAVRVVFLEEESDL